MAMATHSSTLALKIPWMEEPGRLQFTGLWQVRHDWVASLSLFTFMHWRRKWQPTPVSLPGESQGWGEPGGLPSMGSHRVRHDWSDLAAALGSQESDTTQQLNHHQHHMIYLDFPGGSVVKNPHAMQEIGVWPLSQEHPLENKWQPIPVSLPGKFHGEESLVGYSPGGHKESDVTEWLCTSRRHMIYLQWRYLQLSLILSGLLVIEMLNSAGSRETWRKASASVSLRYSFTTTAPVINIGTSFTNGYNYPFLDPWCFSTSMNPEEEY